MKKHFILALSVATTLGFVSCSKDDDDVVDTDASVRVVNTMPNVGAVNFFVDGAKRNSSSFGFGEATGYFGVTNGERTVEFKSATGDNTLLTSPADFSNGNYTLFATGISSNNTLATVLVGDDLKEPAAGKARIRVAHMAPDAPNVNVLVNDSLVLTNAAFKSVSGFIEIPARSYTVKLNNTSNGSTIYTTPSEVTLAAGENYTLTAQGLTSGTGQVTAPFSINVITY